jgi:hypothetical protein
MPYDDNSRDSLSTERRIMSCGPDTVIPTRRILRTGSLRWIVGQGSPDIGGSEVMRMKYILHRADALAQVRSFSEALQGVGTKDLWANRLWIKEAKESEESSGLYDGYHIFFSASEDLRDPEYATAKFFDGREENVLVKIEDRWHLVRATLNTAGGFLAAVADELPEPVVTDVEYTVKILNRLADTKTEVKKTVKAVNLRWQSHFTYLAQYAAKYERGDAQIIVLKADIATPSAADTIKIQNRTMRVVEVLDQGSVWSLHVRHV